MSTPPLGSLLGVGWRWGFAKRDDIIGFQRDARAPLNQGARATLDTGRAIS
jgi:hypothetical protein